MQVDNQLTLRQATYPNLMENLARGCWLVAGFALSFSVSITGISFALTLLCYLLSTQIKPWLKPSFNHPLSWLLVIFVGMALIGLTYGHVPWSNRLSELRNYSKLLFFPLLLSLCRDVRWQRYFINAFLLGVIFTLVVSFAINLLPIAPANIPSDQIFAIHGIHALRMRLDGVFYNHINYSIIIAFAAYLVAQRLFAAENYKKRTFYAVFLVLLTLQQFYFSSGRIGYVLYFALAILIWQQHYGWRGLVIGLLAMSFLAAIAYFSSGNFRDRIDVAWHNAQHYQTNNDNVSPVALRMEYVANTWQLIKRHPWLGYGTGSFQSLYFEHYGTPKGWGESRLDTPHNDYLITWVQFGVIGLLLYIALLFTLWRCSKVSSKQALPNSSDQLLQGLLLSIVISAFFASVLTLSVLGHFFIYFACVLLGPDLYLARYN